MAILLQASAAHGKHEVPADTHTPWALVLIGSPGPPAPAESPLGISENAQERPTGDTNSLSHLLLCLFPMGVPSSRVSMPHSYQWRGWSHVPAPLLLHLVAGCSVGAASTPVFHRISATKVSRLLTELVSLGHRYRCWFLVRINLDPRCAWHTHS